MIQIDYDFRKDKIIFRMPDIAETNSELPIFIRPNHRNLIFRLYQREYRVIGEKIVFKIPQEAQAVEERKGGDRYVFPLNSDISLSLKRM